MKLFYSEHETPGYSGNYREIFYIVWAIDVLRFSHATNISLLEFDIIDEAENIDLCLDLDVFIGRLKNRKNIDGKKKYCIDVSVSPALYVEPDWVELIDEE